MRIAIISLLPDTGHMINLLRIGSLLQENGIEVKFFGPDENEKLCQEKNIPCLTFDIQRPEHYLNNLEKLSRASRFWQKAIIYKWFYTNYYEKTIYNGYQKADLLFQLTKSYNPCAILCDSHLFRATYELIALNLSCPIIFNIASGTYAYFQPKNHVSNGENDLFCRATLTVIQKILGKGLTVYYQLFKKDKFISDECISKYILEYLNNYKQVDLKKLQKLSVSSGIGVLEKKYLAPAITIPDHVFQVGPIPYKVPNSISSSLLNWLNQDSKPVVYIGFGSMIKGIFPFFSDILKAVNSEGFRVLWSHSEKPWSDSQDSALLRWEKWVPQLNVLSHDNVKMFISHGGAGAITEALWFSKPIICIPFLWDHYYNSWLIEKICGIPPLLREKINIKTVKTRMQTALAMQEKINIISAELQAIEGSNELVGKIYEFVTKL